VIKAEALVERRLGMKRSKDMIISQILDICMTGASKTKIVYQANLNFRTVNPYIDLLSKNNLIEVINGSITIYKTTGKGKKMLKEFKNIQEELPELYEGMTARDK
jgi:predicted transcriptional regulator